jgi:tRNA pseudouridine38-40 synthase
LSYCGTAYNGWQNQPHAGTITVQSVIENALNTFLRQKIDITGCGRTDKGVHARDYYAHFDIDSLDEIPTLIFRLNKLLPQDIAIHEIIKVAEDAHARFDAISRSYEYHLHIEKSPFDIHSFYYTYDIPKIEILNDVAKLMLDHVDFTTFCKFHTDVKTMNCRITESRWEQIGNRYIYRVTADRFLRGMIRLIVGACLQVSRGKLSIEEVKIALAEKRRTGHDWSVPASGLFLCDIRYPYL